MNSINYNSSFSIFSIIHVAVDKSSFIAYSLYVSAKKLSHLQSKVSLELIWTLAPFLVRVTFE